MSEIRTVLFIDDDSAHVEAFQKAVLVATDGPFQSEWVRTLSEGVERLNRKGIWAIFANLCLPDSKGLDTFDSLALAAPGVPALVLAGAGEAAVGTEAMRRGAKDFLLEGHIDAYSFARTTPPCGWLGRAAPGRAAPLRIPALSI